VKNSGILKISIPSLRIKKQSKNQAENKDIFTNEFVEFFIER
tara:strand:+ start:2298 stop:2423 length:126 start_codon:yes stop_codon:yes gene_type:complete